MEKQQQRYTHTYNGTDSSQYFNAHIIGISYHTYTISINTMIIECYKKVDRSHKMLS